MKKVLSILFVLIVSSQVVKAQQGFGTSSPAPSSVIDMTATNKGALLPRVALTSTTVAAPVNAPANSLTVFNTATAGDVAPGYYYWRKDLVIPANSRWVRLLDDITPGIEPWQVQGSTNKATLNTQNIYQTGSVAIGKNAVQTGVTLDVVGAVRGGANHSGTVGANSVAFGDDNKASGEATVVAGGGGNNVTQPYSSIGGGFMNSATGQFNTIAGGQSNEASASMVTIAGGYNNKATNNATVISGGQNNKAAGIYSVIAGGTDNETGAANASYSVVAGGNRNIAIGDASTISGGVYNTTEGNNSTISGGLQNKAVGANSVVSGGTSNIAQSFGEWVGGINSTNYVPASAIGFMAKDRLFNIGNGNSGSVSDAFTILKDATTGIGFSNFETTTFNQKLQVNGNARFATLPSIAGDIATDKLVVADATGVLKTVPMLSPNNIYNANGTLTAQRTVTMGDKQLAFVGDHQQTTMSVYSGLLQEGRASSPYGQGSIAIYGADKNANSNRTAMSLQAFADGSAQIYAYEEASSLNIGTHGTKTAAPIVFVTSAGSDALGTEKMRITGTGNVGIATDAPSEKLDVADGNLRVRTINANIGSSGDKVVVADVNGVLKTAGFAMNVTNIVSVATAYSVLANDYTIIADAEAGGFTLTIPAAAPANKGRIIVIRKIDESANLLTFSQSIKKSKTVSFTTLNVNSTIRIQSDGANWYKID